jgi:hypothetical protein
MFSCAEKLGRVLRCYAYPRKSHRGAPKCRISPGAPRLVQCLIECSAGQQLYDHQKTACNHVQPVAVGAAADRAENKAAG